jgi:hypothetical protein
VLFRSYFGVYRPANSFSSMLNQASRGAIRIEGCTRLGRELNSTLFSDVAGDIALNPKKENYLTLRVTRGLQTDGVTPGTISSRC